MRVVRVVVAVMALAAVNVMSSSLASAAGTSLTASLSRTVIIQGSKVTATGVLTPAHPGTGVVLERLLPGSVWSVRGYTTTSATGTFSITAAPSEAGYYTFRIRTAYGHTGPMNLHVLPTVVLDPGGMNQLRLGMTQERAIATEWIVSVPLSDPCCWHEGVLQPGMHGIHAMFKGDVLTYIYIDQGVGVTLEGLRTGSLTSAVTSIYPAPKWFILWPPIALNAPPIFFIEHNGVTLYFGTINRYDRVTSLGVGTFS